MRAHNFELRAADEQETKRGRKNKNRDIVKRTKKEKEEQGIQIDIVIPRRQSQQLDSSSKNLFTCFLHSILFLLPIKRRTVLEKRVGPININ